MIKRRRAEEQQKLIRVNYRTRLLGAVRIGGGGAHSQIEDDIIYKIYKSLELRMKTFSNNDIHLFFKSVLDSSSNYTTDPTKSSPSVKYINITDHTIYMILEKDLI